LINEEKEMVLKPLMILLTILLVLVGSIINLPQIAFGADVRATAYYTIYESEMDGTQTITLEISGRTYTLKASFLFGGFGIAMQGTGRTGPGGDYIHYSGGGRPWRYRGLCSNNR